MSPDAISWQVVYYYFNKWIEDGSFQNAWIAILQQHLHKPDLSSIQLDGSPTTARQGGEAVGYQGERKQLPAIAKKGRKPFSILMQKATGSVT